MSTFEELSALGTCLSKFNQTTFRGNTKEAAGKDISGGYCSGVCLDWMRRTLLSAPDRKVEFLGYASTRSQEEPKRKEANLQRMAVVFDKNATTYVNETTVDKAVAGVSLLLKDKKISWAQREAVAELYRSPRIGRGGLRLLKDDTRAHAQGAERAGRLPPQTKTGPRWPTSGTKTSVSAGSLMGAK